MTLVESQRLLPLLILAATAAAWLLVNAFLPRRWLSAGLTMAGLLAALVATGWPIVAGGAVTTLLVMDGFSLLYLGLIIASALAVAALAGGYLERVTRRPDEFYLLLLLATVGAGVLVAANHFASLFLGLELLSVSLYGLIAYTRQRVQSVEAGTKYLVLAALSSAFLLFGMALVYAELGTLEFSQMSRALGGGHAGSLSFQAGMALLVGGIAFKLALVPFHLWTPDVYQGAPAPVSAFVATVSKGSMFALLLRYFAAVDIRTIAPLFAFFTVMAVASMLIGNLLALLQGSVKRMLAYSSIAHLGYLLVAFLAGGEDAPVAVTFYLVAYFAATLGAFGVVTVLSAGRADADAAEDYAGLMWRRPGLGLVLGVSLLSLAGIPLTAGFVGKFYVLAAGVDSALWFLALTLVAGSAIGLFYYLGLIVIMCRPASVPRSEAPTPRAARVVLAAMLLLIVWFGVLPTALIGKIQASVGLNTEGRESVAPAEAVSRQRSRDDRPRL